MLGFQEWLVQEGLGKWDAKRKRHLPITSYEGSWADQEEKRRRAGEPLPDSIKPKGPFDNATKIGELDSGGRFKASEARTWNAALKDYEAKEADKMKDFRAAKAQNERDKAQAKPQPRNNGTRS